MDAITDLNAEQTESITTVVAGIHSLDSESAAESLEETLAAAEAGAELAYAAQYVLASSGYFLSTALTEVTYVAQAGGAYLAWNITDSQAEKTYLRLEETAATARDAGIVEINAEQWTREQSEFATLLTSAAVTEANPWLTQAAAQATAAEQRVESLAPAAEQRAKSLRDAERGEQHKRAQAKQELRAKSASAEVNRISRLTSAAGDLSSSLSAIDTVLSTITRSLVPEFPAPPSPTVLNSKTLPAAASKDFTPPAQDAHYAAAVDQVLLTFGQDDSRLAENNLSPPASRTAIGLSKEAEATVVPTSEGQLTEGLLRSETPELDVKAAMEQAKKEGIDHAAARFEVLDWLRLQGVPIDQALSLFTGFLNFFTGGGVQNNNLPVANTNFTPSIKDADIPSVKDLSFTETTGGINSGGIIENRDPDWSKSSTRAVQETQSIGNRTLVTSLSSDSPLVLDAPGTTLPAGPSENIDYYLLIIEKMILLFRRS